jgi:glycosyltransferase involved in cell wall biosynthesis
VLVLSRNYPNPVFEHVGPWVQRQVHALSGPVASTVVAPVPYCPPLPRTIAVARFRQIERQRQEGPVAVHHPRFLIGPGYSTHSLEAWTYHAGVRRLVSRLHRKNPFDLIHAHFCYPDGVVAAWLGRAHGIPVVVTEHSFWRPWLTRYPLVRRQVRAAARRFAAHVCVSSAVLHSVQSFTGSSARQHVIPIGVDGRVFPEGPPANERRDDQLLFVGRLNPVKGPDILLRGFARLVARRPAATLVIVGGGFYRSTERPALDRLVVELGLEGRVAFVDALPPPEVSRLMRESALLVSASRRESCGAVLIEALASGLPVVATRSGGPEDFVTDDVGLLVPGEDPAALADGMERLLLERHRFDPAALRSHALSRFAWEHLAERYLEVYTTCVEDATRPRRVA